MIKQILQAGRYLHLPLLVLLAAVQISAQPRFALILSGGGARGLSQIGVLKALESEGLRPDLIVATSMGAIIGALYAAGYSADSIATMAREVDWDEIFSNTSLRKTRFVSQKNESSGALFELRFDYNLKPLLPTSISYGQSIYNLLVPQLIVPQAAAKSNFDSLPIPLRIIATDLLTGRKIVFSNGNICAAVRASCAVPLAFSPVETDSFLLIDGGVSANIPVETALLVGARCVVAVDATSPLARKNELSNPVKVVDQIVSISIAHQKERERNKADVVITPHLNNIKNTDFKDINNLISLGYASALARIDTIRQLLESHPSAATVSDSLHSSDRNGIPFTRTTARYGICDSASKPFSVLRTMKTAGNRRTSPEIVRRASGLKTGDTLTAALVRKTVASLYATDLFDNVNLNIDSAGCGTVIVEEKNYWRASFGLRFDEFHLGEGYIEPAYENCFGLGIVALLHLQYGLRRERYTFEMSGTNFISRNFTNNVHIQLYSSKERIHELDTIESDSVSMVSTAKFNERILRKTGINAAIGAQLGRFSLLNAGIRLERFSIQQQDVDVLRDLLGTSSGKTLPYFSLKLTMDSMDKYPFPTSGIRQYLSIGAATEALGGRYTFIKCTGSFSRYITLFGIHTFCPRISFAWASDVLPEVERGYIGGTLTEERHPESSVYNYIPFSGLPPRALMGDMFGICRLEYRCEVKRNLYAHLLLDWGTAWDATNKKYHLLAEDAPFGMGVGLSYMTILGPVRFSYGQLLKNNATYLTDQKEFFYFSAGYDF